MFSPGDFVYHLENEEYQIYQILKADSDYLVKDFWETNHLNVDEVEIRANVKRLEIDDLRDFSFIMNRNVKSNDEEEIRKFLAIEKGLNARKNRTNEMSVLVESAILKEDYNSALELLTEWAMLDKYRPEIYLLREKCFRNLGRMSEADYELHVYQTIIGK